MPEPEPEPIACHRDLPERESPCGCVACVELRAERAGLLHLHAHLGSDQAPGWAFADDPTPDPHRCSTDATAAASTRPNGWGPGSPTTGGRSPRTHAPSAASPAAGPTARSTNDAT